MSENEKIKGEIGEKFVNDLAFNTFFDYWCFPNPIDENGDKKEICDLLILFKEIIIIISVKNYTFKGDHERYFKKTIDKAIKQIYGAERKLFQMNNSIVFIHPIRGKYNFNPDKYKKVFRLIVNVGEGELFYIIGSDEEKKEFINIFNKEAFESIIKELDTISDFIEYLEKREELFKRKDVLILNGKDESYNSKIRMEFLEYCSKRDLKNKKSITITGSEKDILAHYLTHERDFASVVKSTDFDDMWIELDDEWQDYKNREEVKKKSETDKISYFVDQLVKQELMQLNNGNELASELLSLSRYERRVFSKYFFNFYEKYQSYSNSYLFTAKRYGEISNYGVVFFFYSNFPDEGIVNFLIDLAIDGFALYSNFKMKKIICLGVKGNMQQFKFALKEIEPFETNKIARVKEDCKKINWFQNLEERRFSEKEYPD